MTSASAKRRALGAALIAAIAVLAGCAAEPPPPHAPITFGDRPAIAMDVAAVEVVQAYEPPLAPPHVEHLAPTPPSRAVARWAADRLAAVGDAGMLRVVVTDARIVAEALDTTGGLRGIMTVQQAERYRLSLAVRLDAEKPDGRAATARATVETATSVAEGASLYEREQALHRLTQRGMAELDRELTAGIDRWLFGFRPGT